MSVKVLYKYDAIDDINNIEVAGGRVFSVAQGWVVDHVEYWQDIETREVDEMVVTIRRKEGEE